MDGNSAFDVHILSLDIKSSLTRLGKTGVEEREERGRRAIESSESA